MIVALHELIWFVACAIVVGGATICFIGKVLLRNPFAPVSRRRRGKRPAPGRPVDPSP